MKTILNILHIIYNILLLPFYLLDEFIHCLNTPSDEFALEMQKREEEEV